MLEPVMAARHGRLRLRPNDFLVIIEADATQSGLHLDGVPRSMPHIAHLEPGQQLKRGRPIGDRVSRDAGPLVPLGPVLHVARLRPPEFVDLLPVPPFGIEFNSIGRVRDHQYGFAPVQ